MFLQNIKYVHRLLLRLKKHFSHPLPFRFFMDCYIDFCSALAFHNSNTHSFQVIKSTLIFYLLRPFTLVEFSILTLYVILKKLTIHPTHLVKSLHWKPNQKHHQISTFVSLRATHNYVSHIPTIWYGIQ